VIAWRNQASFIYHDYPQAFAERYYGSEGVINDPVLSACRGQVKPVSWRAYERSPFYAEAQNFGLFDGLTVPVHGPGSLVVAVTVAGRTLIGPREVVELPRVLESLGRETVERVGFKDQRGASPAVVLSKKQALVLCYLAEGVPQGEIAKTLGVSRSAVKHLIERAMNVLGAANQTQAVAIAIQEGKLGFRQAS